jgi:hypothetical protein
LFWLSVISLLIHGVPEEYMAEMLDRELPPTWRPRARSQQAKMNLERYRALYGSDLVTAYYRIRFNYIVLFVSAGAIAIYFS